MFVCKACLRRGLGALASESRLLARPAAKQAVGSLGAGSRRLASSAAVGTTTQPTPEPSETATDLAEQRRAEKLEWVVNKHLKYLSDPYKIAEHVLRTLEADKFDEALLLVRKASRDTKVVVSWNHLIDYLMRKQRLSSAVKIFNEMKKRAQFPDVKTYTIIFRGCAKSQHPKLAVSEAVRIFNSMNTDKRVSPNTIHLNAVLDVCSRAGDLDSMFNVLQSLNNATRKPDSQTYTIVLNALRHKPGDKAANGVLLARHEYGEMTEEEVATSITRAKMIWQDVMTRWNNGQLLLDEDLVCAMGRILIMGDHSDRNSILELLESTMKLPRFDLEGGATKTSTSPEDKQMTAVEAGSSTAPKPTNNTLSLVMHILAVTKKTSLAPKYWRWFVAAHNVKPDRANYISYLKVLMKGRASTHTAKTVKAMPAEYLQPFIFRTALSTCIHDELNHSAFSNACMIYDTMVGASAHPDPLSMRLFLQSARGNVRHLYEQHKDDPKAARLAVGTQIVAAVDRLWKPFRFFVNSLEGKTEQRERSKKGLWGGLTEGEMAEVSGIARRIIAAIDVINNESMIEDEATLKRLRGMRIVLNKFVERHFDNWELPKKSKAVSNTGGRTDENIFPRIA